MKIKFLKQFRKDSIKLNQRQTRQLKERINLFQIDPTHPALNNHPLKGRLKGRFSINITGDIRAIYHRKKKCGEKEDIIEFIKLGSHSELY